MHNEIWAQSNYNHPDYVNKYFVLLELYNSEKEHIFGCLTVQGKLFSKFTIKIFPCQKGECTNLNGSKSAINSRCIPS